MFVVEAHPDEELEEEDLVSELAVEAVHGSFGEDLRDDASHQHVEGKVFVFEMPITRNCRWEKFVRPPGLSEDYLGADFIISWREDLLHFGQIRGS